MRKKILYIGGPDRAGSTFLSILLTQTSDSFNLGQVRDFPAAMRRNADCSCDNSMAECAFWGPVAGKFSSVNTLKKLYSVRQGYKEFRRETRETGGWNKKANRKLIAKSHRKFLGDLDKIYVAAAEVAGESKILVDSSKSPEQALALSLLPDTDLYILNLIRDPRAMVCSWYRKNNDATRSEIQATEWRKRQRLFGQLNRFNPDGFKRLRYEDLTESPRQTIEDIQAWAGIKVNTEHFLDDFNATVTWDNQHLFPPTNEGVLAARATAVKIRSSDSWKADEFSEIRKGAIKVAFPFAERFGYSLSEEEAAS